MTNNNKYSTEEGLKELTRSLLMMKYDNSKTLNEQLTLLGGPSMLAGQITTTQKVGELVKKGSNFVYKCATSFKDGDIQNFIECISTLRDKMYTSEGLITTAVVEVLGSEIGVPIVVETLGNIFLMNDSMNFVRTYKNPPSTVKTVKEKFLWLWENNKDFQRLIEDIFFIVLNVVGPYVLKGGATVLGKLIEILGKSTGTNLFEKIGYFIMTKWGLLKKSNDVVKSSFLQKFIQRFDSGVNDITKIFTENLGKTASKVVSKIIPATITGIITDLFIKGFEWVIGKFSKKFDEQVTNVENYEMSDEQFIEHIIFENPFLGEIKYNDKIQNYTFNFERDNNGSYYVFTDTDFDDVVEKVKIDGDKDWEPWAIKSLKGTLYNKRIDLTKYVNKFKKINKLEFCINDKYYSRDPQSFKLIEKVDSYNKCKKFENPYSNKSDWMSSQTPKSNLVNRYK